MNKKPLLIGLCIILILICVVNATPPNKPTDPAPFNGQTNVLVTANLTWTGGGATNTKYDVYFIEGDRPIKKTNNQSETEYDPSLSEGECYCWKIVAWNNDTDESINGSYWQFCTLADIDSFEKDYTSIWKNYSGYNKTDEGCYEGSDIDTGAFINMIPAFYTEKVGGVFWLFIFSIPFIVSFIKQESVIIPTILGLLVSSSMFFFLPMEYQTPARSLFYISLAGILYSFFKSRSY